MPLTTSPFSLRKKKTARVGSTVLGRSTSAICSRFGNSSLKKAMSTSPSTAAPRGFEQYQPITPGTPAPAISSRARSFSSSVRRNPGPLAWEQWISIESSNCTRPSWRMPSNRPPTPIPMRGRASKPSHAWPRILSMTGREYSIRNGLWGSVRWAISGIGEERTEYSWERDGSQTLHYNETVPKAKDLEGRLQRIEQQLRLFQKVSRFMVRDMSLAGGPPGNCVAGGGIHRVRFVPGVSLRQRRSGALRFEHAPRGGDRPHAVETERRSDGLGGARTAAACDLARGLSRPAVQVFRRASGRFV